MSCRVLFLDHTAELGGAELSLLGIASEVPFSCHVLLLSDGPFREQLLDAGVSVEIISGSSGLHAVRRDSRMRSLLASIPAVFSLVRLIAKKAKDYDVIYANTQKSFVVAALASVVSRKPVVWHLRDILDSEHFSSTTRKAVILLANMRAQMVIANSMATESAFHAAGGAQELTEVIYNAIDPRPFDNLNPGNVNNTRKSITSSNVVLVGVFGRLAQWKGQHVLIEAVKDLPDIHAVIIGASLFGEEKYENRLKVQVKKLGLQDRVHFLGFRSEIPELMKAMDIIVHTSIAPEPFGRVVVEGMLAERPVVATKAGGVLEIIDDNKTGLLVKPGSSTDLARAIKRLINDQDLSRRLTTQAKHDALVRFSPDRMLKQIALAIESVIPDCISKEANTSSYYEKP